MLEGRVNGAELGDAASRVEAALGELKVTSYLPTRCGSSANSHETSSVRSFASIFAASAQAYMTEKVQ